VLRELGRGAMGVVYLGSDPKINREVAIKTMDHSSIKPEQLQEEKDRFNREAMAAGNLTHPNIVSIYDVGEEHNISYIAMELLDGTDLTPYTKKDNRLPLSMIFKIIISVASGLDFAHSKGVVHRDIKPANIMFLKNKNIKVADFGIARMVESSQTKTGMAIGTPMYMSPEQITGKKVDGRSDIFSLGVVFFELLTSEKPFQSPNITTLLYNITSGKRPAISELRPQVPPCVIKIVDKILVPNIELRYQRCTDIIEDINNCKKSLIRTTI